MQDRYTQAGKTHMLYLVEIEGSSGVIYVRQYSGRLLWDVVADAEADITYEANSRIVRVWPIDEVPEEVLAMHRSSSASPHTA